MTHSNRLIATLGGTLLFACTGDGTNSDTGIADDTPGAQVNGCRSTPAEANRDRRVLVQTPYSADMSQSDVWRALTLTADGTLRDDNESHTLGRAIGGTMVFTPDGSLGFVAQEDGSIGHVEISSEGTIRVLDPGFSGDFYATQLVADPTGEVLWIVDQNWPENGGGIYQADIDCTTGALSAPTRVLESQNAADLLLLPGGSESERPALIFGRAVPGTSAGADVAWVDILSTGDASADASAFGDNEAIQSDATLIQDSRYALVGDYSAFASVPNRVAVIEVGDASLEAVQVLPDLLDPVVLVASPWDDQVLAISGYGNGYFQLLPTGNDSTPFENAGEPTYTGTKPQLPAAAAVVSSGSLKGRVLITENEGIRQVQLGQGGTFEDLELVSIGDSFEGIVGAIGVAP